MILMTDCAKKPARVSSFLTAHQHTEDHFSAIKNQLETPGLSTNRWHMGSRKKSITGRDEK